MKRLLASIVVLAFVACDKNTTQAEGTSSETATSLKLLAARLAGANLRGLAAPGSAARSLASTRWDTLLWRDISDVPGGLPEWADTFSYYNYGTTLRYGPFLSEYEHSTHRLSASRGVRTISMLGGDDRATVVHKKQDSVWGCYADNSCGDERSPTDDGMDLLSAEFSYHLRNGSTLVLQGRDPNEISTGQGDVVVDGRWTLKMEARASRIGTTDTTVGWFVYRVYEKGVWIGTLSARNEPSETPRGIPLHELNLAVLVDREGNVVTSEGVDPPSRHPLRVDSVGLMEFTARFDSSRTHVLAEGRWSMLPRKVPPGLGNAVLYVSYLFADDSIMNYEQTVPSLGAEGPVAWSLPVQPRGNLWPEVVRIRYIQSDLPQGGSGRAHFLLHIAQEVEIAR